MWSSSNDARKLNFVLYGVQSLNYDVDCAFFQKYKVLDLIMIVFGNHYLIVTIDKSRYESLTRCFQCNLCVLGLFMCV